MVYIKKVNNEVLKFALLKENEKIQDLQIEVLVGRTFEKNHLKSY